MQQALPALDITLYSEDTRLNAVWGKAFDAWINNYKSPSTVRAYRDNWRLFIEFAQKPPWKIGRSTIVDWLGYMRERGLLDATIQQRLAALSSFYDFVCRDYTVINGEGREVPLYDLFQPTPPHGERHIHFVNWICEVVKHA